MERKSEEKKQVEESFARIKSFLPLWLLSNKDEEIFVLNELTICFLSGRKAQRNQLRS